MEGYLKEQIDNLYEKIKEIYYIQDYDVAKTFEERLENIKDKIIELGDEYINIKLREEIANDIASLEFDIVNYFSRSGDERKKKINHKVFEAKIKKFIEESEEKDNGQLIEGLKELTQSTKDMEVENMLFEKLHDLSAKALLEIYIRQIKNEEEIDLSLIDEISKKDRFIEQIRKKLIEQAQGKNQEKAFDLLNLSKRMEEKDLIEEKVWQELTGKEEIKIAGINKEKQTTELAKTEETELAIIPERKPSFWEKLRLKMEIKKGRTTKYTLADINEQTGIYGNVRVEYHEFPVKDSMLNKKLREHCIEIEINDRNKVDLDDILYMKNLKGITFGRNVREILWHANASRLDPRYEKVGYVYVNRAKPKRIVFSDDVEKISTYDGQGNLDGVKDELEEVVFGDKIKRIPTSMLSFAKRLLKIKFPAKLEEIQDEAFFQCESLKKIELPETCRRIGKKVFYYCSELEEFKGQPRFIGDGCFGFCNKLKRVTLYDKPEIVDQYIFSGNEPLEELVIPKKIEKIDDLFYVRKGTKVIYLEDLEKDKEDYKESIKVETPISEIEEKTENEANENKEIEKEESEKGE